MIPNRTAFAAVLTVLAALIATTAAAQTTAPLGPDSVGVERSARGGTRGQPACKGRIAGRWRLSFSDPVTLCTLEVTKDGTVRRGAGRRTACRGVLLDHTAVLDGQVNRVAPLTNKHGSSNQCWIHGKIQIGAGTLEIIEAFITKGSGSFSGVGIYIDGTRSVVTATRY